MAILRQQIIDAIDTKLKTITVANSYNTNIGNNVFHWKENPFEANEIPGLDYRDIFDIPTDEVIGEQLHTIALEIRAYATGASVDETARKMVVDIVKAIGSDLTWGGLAEDTIQVGVADEIDMEHKDKKIVGVTLKFEIEYTSERFSP